MNKKIKKIKKATATNKKSDNTSEQENTEIKKTGLQKNKENLEEIKNNEQLPFLSEKITAENIEKEINSAPAKPKVFDPADENNVNEKYINNSEEEIIKKQLLDYGGMIMSNINDFWAFRIRGKMPKSELINIINNCYNIYNYNIGYVNDSAYITIEYKNITVRIPSDNTLIPLEV